MGLAAWIGSAPLGCTVYSELEGLSRPDGSAPPADGRTTIEDAPSSSDRTMPPGDVTGGDDARPPPDVSTIDVAVDARLDAPPSMDVTPPDAGADGTVSVDAIIDTTTPPPSDAARDTAIDRGADTALDTSGPPAPDAGPDIRTVDAVDAGASADADATPPPVDADSGTGTPDVVDSGPTCWGGTPSTNDEDGDGVVDECDNCPSIANANQADVREVNAGGTADGVGDACDPRPTLGGDSIYLFDGLNFTSFPADWTNIGAGTWSASGSTVTANGTDTGQELARNFPTGLGNYLAETAFTFNALTTNGSSSLPFRRDGAGNGWRCVVGTPDGIAGQFFLSKVTAGTSETTPPEITTIGVPHIGDRYRVQGGAYSDTIYCRLGSGESQTRTDTSTTGESGFRSTGTSADFEYLLVYRLGGAL